MERRILLETLADQLPQDSISFSSKLADIEKKENGEILLEFENGNRLSAKVCSSKSTFALVFLNSLPTCEQKYFSGYPISANYALDIESLYNIRPVISIIKAL